MPSRSRRFTALFKTTSLAALLSAGLPGAAAWAEDILLNPIIVSATRSPALSFGLPASVTAIDRQRLTTDQANTLSKTLRKQPGVEFGGGARAQAQIPTIRGLSGPRVILSVDGARRNYEGGLHSPLLLDPDLLDGVEVVRGPMSAAYGSGGLGGVMAFETLDPEDILTDGQAFGGRVKLGYHGANNERATNLTLARQSGDLGLLFSGTLRSLGDITPGAGSPDAEYPNDGSLRSGLLKAVYSPSDLHRFEFSYQAYNDSGEGPNNPGGNLLFPFSQILKRDQKEIVASWAFKGQEGGWLDGKLSVYGTTFRHDTTSLATPPLADTSTELATAGISFQNTSSFATGAVEHRLTYGFDSYRDTNAVRSGGVANSVTPDGTMTATGVFVQDEISFGAKVSAIAALRFDTYNMTSPGQTGSSAENLSPKLSLHYQVNDAIGLYASYGEAFRAPTMTETYGNLNTTAALFNFRANPTLRPETARTAEIGATLALDGLARGDDSLRVKASVFSENVTDLIDSVTVGTYTRAAPFVGTGLIFQRQNVAKANRYGGELTVDYAVGDFTFGAAYSKVRSRNAATGANLFAPPDKLGLGASWQINDQWSVSYGAQFVAAQDYDATLLRQRPSYAVHDIGASWTKGNARLDIGVSNLFDESYATYQQTQANTYSYEEGRSLNVSFAMSF